MSEEEINQERFYKVLEDVIDQAFQQSWRTVAKKKEGSKEDVEMVYESIEEYKEKTGKRFRMTREQKERGVSREEAFKEIWQKS
jgi:hypothetical protein